MNSKIKNIAEWIWQLPQNLCGIAWRRIKKDSIIAEVGNSIASSVNAKVYLMKAGGGVTLGKYIFISQTYQDQSKVIKHECGHVKQSKMLGPLYLIIIGIPSLLHCWYNDFVDCCWKDGKYHYEHFYTEKWADKLMEED